MFLIEPVVHLPRLDAMTIASKGIEVPLNIPVLESTSFILQALLFLAAMFCKQCDTPFVRFRYARTKWRSLYSPYWKLLRSRSAGM